MSSIRECKGCGRGIINNWVGIWEAGWGAGQR